MPLTIEQLQARVGDEIGISPPQLVSQQTIDAFATVTNDRQFIHVDPVAAQKTGFGGTIAHGFLSLSLLTSMFNAAVPPIAGTSMSVNYGFDKVRFLAPVPSGSALVGAFRLLGCEQRKGAQWLLRFGVEVKIVGSDATALYAEWLILVVLGT
jgi:acyl dehydratase